jgi:type I restriction enzyme S subunit
MCNTQQTAIDFSKDIIGKVLLVPDIFDGDIVSSHHVNTIKFFNENLKLYFFRFFNTDFFHKYISNFANGTSILGLIFSGVEDYMAVIPPDSVLNEFNKLMFKIEKKKNLIIKEKINLIKLRDYLLPLFMNGQITIN